MHYPLAFTCGALRQACYVTVALWQLPIFTPTMRKLSLLMLAFAPLVSVPARAQRIVYVDSSAATGGDGTSWGRAFRSLQDGIASARAGDTLWVARGTYRPDDGQGIARGDRNASFALGVPLTVLGGFRGTETHMQQRDLVRNVTLLSGDLLGNDGAMMAIDPSRDDNALSVVSIPTRVTAIRVSDLHITGAYRYAIDARSPFFIWRTRIYRNLGAGLSTLTSYISIYNCTFDHNIG